MSFSYSFEVLYLSLQYDSSAFATFLIVLWALQEQTNKSCDQFCAILLGIEANIGIEAKKSILFWKMFFGALVLNYNDFIFEVSILKLPMFSNRCWNRYQISTKPQGITIGKSFFCQILDNFMSIFIEFHLVSPFIQHLYQIQEALSACPNESKIKIPPAPLAAYLDQAIISFFLNISRTLHQRAELGVVNIGHQWPATTIKQHRWTNWCEYY